MEEIKKESGVGMVGRANYSASTDNRQHSPCSPVGGSVRLRQLGVSDFALGNEENVLLHFARLTSNDVPLRRSRQTSCALGFQSLWEPGGPDTSA